MCELITQTQICLVITQTSRTARTDEPSQLDGRKEIVPLLFPRYLCSLPTRNINPLKAVVEAVNILRPPLTGLPAPTKNHDPSYYWAPFHHARRGRLVIVSYAAAAVFIWQAGSGISCRKIRNRASLLAAKKDDV